jgi:hypothetical protein
MRKPRMHHYSVFGGCLRSELEFPDLSPTSCRRPDWTVRLAPEPRVRSDDVPLGEQLLGDVTVRLYRTVGGFRLEYATFGTVCVSEDGSRITWHPGPAELPEFSRAVLLGPALALALHQTGVVCLHGSAVALDHAGLAFLAPKFYGKSTLAFALVTAGAKLLSDDALAVDPGAPPMVRPGVHSVRLWADSAEWLRVSELAGQVVAGLKQTAAGLPPTLLARQCTPLSAVYLLRPIRSDVERIRVKRTRLRVVPATVSLAHHTKLVDPLIGYVAAGSQLRWAALLAQAVPVYTLRFCRRFDCLQEVVARLVEWHRARRTALPLIAVGGR